MSRTSPLAAASGPDDHGAFVPHAPLAPPGPARAGPLAGMTLAVKDLFDVGGLRTGAGNPDWLAQARPAAADAWAVARLRAAGAGIVGKTITDELAWSLNGENPHYGTPRNPAAPGRIPGGSSAGSAVAVAAGLADLALGTDTGGSVRLPASYCGIWGIRPTHGAIPVAGLVPLAPSYDTVGWFAAAPGLLARAGEALLPPAAPAPIARLALVPDLFAETGERGAELRDAARGWAGSRGLPLIEARLTVPVADLREAFRVTQWAEVWETHGAWVRTRAPRLDPAIAARFDLAQALGGAEIAAAHAARADHARAIRAMVPPGTALMIPGAATPPPPCGMTGPALDALRGRALGILSLAGIAGLPQLAMPAVATPEGPLGLGLVGAPGADRALLGLVA
jgi:amidase